MRVFLAGVAPWKNEGLYDAVIKKERPYTLESFYYVNDDTLRLLPYYKDFLLDSGAFTFMQNLKKKLDWYEYIEKYADFVKKNNIEKFFELDIDSVEGYDKVLEYRKVLEQKTGRQCIPVWHTTRGLDEWIRMCDEYPYVAFGGIAGTGKATKTYKNFQRAFPWFISEAHKRNTKVHALGYTSLEGLKRYHFDSVDSTAWTTGNRFGYIYRFKDGTMTTVDCPKGKKLGDVKKVALMNYSEWIKFQKYADIYY